MQVQCVKDVQTASRKFCHRQYCWFRDDDLYLWVDASEGPDNAIEEMLSNFKLNLHKGTINCLVTSATRLELQLLGHAPVRSGH